MTFRTAVTSTACLALLVGAACSVEPEPSSRLRGAVRIDGSSTVYPITEAVAEEFRKVAPRVRVTVGKSGTGGGFKRFTRGETDISDASRPIRPEEYRATREADVEFVELPVAYDGLSIVVNIDNQFVRQLTVEQLRRIFRDGSRVQRWSDVDPAWPDMPMKIYTPGTDSGTFDYFKEVIAGHDGSIRSDISVSEEDNVLVRGIAGDEGGIGFFGCAYYFENRQRLRAVPIVSPVTGEPVAPTRATIESGEYAPFSRPLFIYVNRSALGRREVKAFVDFYLDNAAELAHEVGYVRLPEQTYEQARENVRRRVTGSAYLDGRGARHEGTMPALHR